MMTLETEAITKFAKLVYVNDQEKGIVRVKQGKSFDYFYNGKKVTDEKQLFRIKSLVIPPAWREVWICKKPNGHLQSTGLDARNRKQYRYHAEWSKVRNLNKFLKLYEFGKKLPLLRAQMKKDFAKRTLCEEKVIATVLYLMENTYIRIGNSQYEKDNNSFGLTTLKDQHVNIAGGKMQFSFVGKKGVDHRISLTDSKLARIVKQCRDIPGKELFQYVAADGSYKTIDSTKVNSYIKAATKSEFTAKDLRTWAGTLQTLECFDKLEACENVTQKKKKVLEVLDEVSAKLGNTRTVCKKYYVHPMILEMYENDELPEYLKKIKKASTKSSATGLSGSEKILMQILKTIK